MAGRTRPYVSREFGEFARMVAGDFPGVFEAQGDPKHYVLDRLVCPSLMVFVSCREFPVVGPARWRKVLLSVGAARTEVDREVARRCIAKALRRQARVKFDPYRIADRVKVAPVESLCPMCDLTIYVGQEVDPGGTSHAGCR